MLNDGICAFDGCEGAAVGRVNGGDLSYCQKHGNYVRRYGVADHALRASCDVDWCTNPAVAGAAHCRSHRYEIKNGGILPRGHKRCTVPGCENPIKPVAEFAPNGGQCRECVRPMYRERNRARGPRPPSTPEKARASRLKHNFGITVEEFDALFLAQNSQCACCGTGDPGVREWCVDHDHACCPGRRSCGKCICAILCFRCNSGIGKFDDNPELMLAMARYLELHAERRASA